MKKLFLGILIIANLLALSIALKAQEVKIATKPFEYTTEQQAIGNATKTTQWVIVNKTRFDLYETAKHSHYYITKDKAGNFVRRYVKI